MINTQAGIFVCLLLAGTACLVVWLLERGELGEEEERRRSAGEESGGGGGQAGDQGQDQGYLQVNSAQKMG